MSHSALANDCSYCTNWEVMGTETALSEKTESLQPVAPVVREREVDGTKVIETKSLAESIRITRKSMKGMTLDWAEAFVREWTWNNSGRPAYAAQLCINSDYGVFAYVWTHMGCKWGEFCQHLEYDYFMTKAHHTKGKRFDPAATVVQVKKQIREYRREGSMEADEAREAYEELDGMEDETLSEGHFCAKMGTHIYSLFIEGSAELSYKRDPQCDAFWKNMWPLLQQAWKDKT